MDDWINEIGMDEIPEQMSLLVDAIGIRPALQLMQVAGGTYMYVPKADAILRRIRDKRIRREYSGYNAKELAVKYKLNVNWIHKIVDAGGIAPGQMRMFDDPGKNQA